MQVTGMNERLFSSIIFFHILLVPLFCWLMIDRLSSDDQAVAAGWGSNELLIAGLAAGVVIIRAAGSAAVELDAVALAGDAISLTGAGLADVAEVAERADGAWGGAV